LVKVLTAQNAVTSAWEQNPELIWALNPTFPDQGYATPRLTTLSAINIFSNPSTFAVPLSVAEMFYSDKGVPIDEDNTFNYSGRFGLRTGDNASQFYIAKGYTTVNDHFNREPRFYVNVSYNGSLWINKSEGNKVIETFFTGNTGKKGSWDFPRTGYIARKNVHPDSNPRITQYVARPFILIRYAEILLNYIEALNEYEPGNPDILKYLNEIRNRAGVPDIAGGLGQAAMREKIRHERRVELALESLRYFDTRRWKIAEQTDGGNFYGMNVDAGTKVTDLVFYQRTIFERRVFLKNYYLFPIPQSEIDRDRKLVQNPGW